jgi:hypothetical protein
MAVPLKGWIRFRELMLQGVKTRTSCDICVKINRTRGPAVMVSASPDKDVYDNLSSMQVKAVLMVPLGRRCKAPLRWCLSPTLRWSPS